MNKELYEYKENARVWRWQMVIRFVCFGWGLFLGYMIGINLK